MMEMLRCSAEGVSIDKTILADVTPGILYEIYAVMNIHGMVHLPANIIDKCGIAVDAPLLEKYKGQIPYALYSYEKMSFETEQMSEIFEEKGVPFVLLKGAVLRNLYSEPWLRPSCDIDVLVQKKDLEKAGQILENELNYKKIYIGTHHITYTSPSEVNIELHFDLIEKNQANKAMKIAKKVWDYAKVQEGYKYRYILDDSFLYFYHIAHCATHFEEGGCGIKPILDLYLLEKNIDRKSSLIKRFLRKSDLEKFEENLINLCDVWFRGKEHDKVTLVMEDFIINGGLRGSPKQNLLFKKYYFNGETGYFLSRLFISLEELKFDYPILKKAVYLTPFFVILRWLKLLFKREKRGMFERYETVKNISQEDMKYFGEMFYKIGL